MDTIKAGDYVIIQRQEYTKLHKLKDKGTIKLGTLLVELDNIVGQRYFESFQMKPKSGSKKLYVLEKASTVEDSSGVSIETSGIDNRHITDDGTSQTLTKDEIEKMRDTSNSTEILGQLVANSRTFAMKTEYSQEKYLKKKERKYFDYVRVRRPNVRLLMTMFYRQDPQKTLGMRIDDLSQLLTYSGVQSEGEFVLYDSGTSGLVTAALLDRIGANTTGRLVHMHPGNECQRNAVNAMQFPQELLNRCINVNVYSVLRWYHQILSSLEIDDMKKNAIEENGNSKEAIVPEVDEPKTDDNKPENSRKRKLLSEQEETPKKKPCWHYENEKACEILRGNVDSIVIVAKEHPVSIVKELMPFLKPSRPLVVFSYVREPLVELFAHLKESLDFVNIQLVNNFMRMYQVLPERTHPTVTMAQGGHVLYAYKVKIGKV